MSDVVAKEVGVPVRFNAGTGQLAGTLSIPAGGARTVQLLVHGYSYSRYYWDFPYEPETYSYARRVNAAGYATLAIDRLGDGASTRPAGRRLTWDNAGLTVAQVVTALRHASLGTAFQNVVPVGHSYGSVTSYLVVGRHSGVTALIATDAAHRVNFARMTQLVLNSPPVRRNPGFEVTDPIYVTTRRDWRGFRYHGANADPAGSTARPPPSRPWSSPAAATTSTSSAPPPRPTTACSSSPTST